MNIKDKLKTLVKSSVKIIEPEKLRIINALHKSTKSGKEKTLR